MAAYVGEDVVKKRKEVKVISPTGKADLWLILPDIHFPDHSPASIEIVKKVASILKPTNTLLLGDVGTVFGAAGQVALTAGGGASLRPDARNEGYYILGLHGVPWIDAVGLILFFGMLAGVSVHAAARYLARRKQPRPQHSTRRLYLYDAYERIWHWLQASAILLLIATGLIIHKPHLFGMFSFAYVVRVHNVLGFILLINAALALFYTVASGTIRRFLPEPRDFFGRAVAQAMYYTRGIFAGEPHPLEKTRENRLNPLQQITYLAILNVLLPAHVVTGILIWGMQEWPRLYYFNLAVTEAAIPSGVSLCDLGGNTDVVWAQLRLDEAARARGVGVVPVCCMGPGLINHMGVYVMELLDRAREVYLYDGGLPQDPVDPWRYQLTFHVNSLTIEYDGEATFIRGGKLVQVPTFTEREAVDFPPLGTLEAFVIYGSLSTTPHTHLGRLERYENKVLRYPGHFATFEAYKRLGLFSQEAVEVPS